MSLPEVLRLDRRAEAAIRSIFSASSGPSAASVTVAGGLRGGIVGEVGPSRASARFGADARELRAISLPTAAFAAERWSASIEAGARPSLREGPGARHLRSRHDHRVAVLLLVRQRPHGPTI
jgi:hypothetical protein